MHVRGEQGTIAFVDGDLKAVISSQVKHVCCKVVCERAMEICSVGVVGNKKVKGKGK